MRVSVLQLSMMLSGTVLFARARDSQKAPCVLSEDTLDLTEVGALLCGPSLFISRDSGSICA